MSQWRHLIAAKIHPDKPWTLKGLMVLFQAGTGLRVLVSGFGYAKFTLTQKSERNLSESGIFQ